MIRSHKIRLVANNRQDRYFRRACGVARFAYNWGLARWKEKYEADEKVNEMIIRKELNAIKDDEFPWMKEVSKCVPQLAIKDGLGRAFKNFFVGTSKYPKFRKKGHKDSFSISNDHFKIEGKKIWIPRLGWVGMREELRFQGKLICATVSRVGVGWYVSIQVELATPKVRVSENQATGIDLGVASLVTLSDGRKIKGVRSTKKYQKQLRRAQKTLSRRKGYRKGEEKSKRYYKARDKVRKIHAKIKFCRQDSLHKTTSMIINSYNVIGIEDLDVSEMLSNHVMAKGVADASFHEFRRQLTYKAEESGCRIVVADRMYPSSKTCSACGHLIKELPLDVRTWECDQCQTVHDRDINAAINLKKYALSHL